MIEILKELVEEPEKREYYILFGLRIIFSVILSSFFFNYFISEYALLEITNGIFWKELYFFIISGRVLLVVFFFLISYILLFEIISPIISFLINKFSRWFGPTKSNFEDMSFARLIFVILGAIKIENKKIKRGPAFDNFYDFIKLNRKFSAKEEIEYLNNTLIIEVIELYFVFSLLYYYVLDLSNNTKLNILIIIIGLILIIIYYSIYFIAQMLEASESHLYNSMRMLRADQIVEDFMHYYDIPLNCNEDNSILATPYAKYVYEDEKLIVLDYLTFDKPISKKHIRKLPKLIKNKNWHHALLISTQKPGPSAKKFLEENSAIATLIVFTSEKSLWKSLYSYFKLAITAESLSKELSKSPKKRL